jgi:hypoxanthine-DNA glycosylase
MMPQDTHSVEAGRKRSFPPVTDGNTRVLILGSLPGERSLSDAQYYAHKQNRFWSLVGDVVRDELMGLPYEQRLKKLSLHRVGLWDVVQEAHRQGSLDSRIRNHVGNDLIGLATSLPALAAIAFNGGTAAKLGSKVLADYAAQRGVTLIALPSSSPAYTLPYRDKLKAWEQLRPWLEIADD